MKQNHLLFLFAALMAFAGPAGAAEESLAAIFTNTANDRPTVVPRRTSIIFIACHGLGYGDLSCYGQTNYQTPNLDRLATEGTRFTNYRVTGDGLSAVQAALMAGNNNPFAPGDTTLAARLQKLTYRTFLIGEWMLGSQPWTQGFEEFGGFLNESEGQNYYPDSFWRYAPKARYDETNHVFHEFVGREAIYQNSGGQKSVFMPDFLMSAAANVIRVHVPDFANHYRPFFLLVNLPAPQSATPGKDEYPVPTDAPFTGENWPQAAKNRAALITRIDAGMGRLFEQLRNVGMSNNVAIFFTGAAAPEKFADTNLNFLTVKGEVRGGESAEHLRVPMIVRWPGHVPAGRVSRVPWSTPDFAPTVIQIAYGKPVASFTGMSVLPVLLDQPGTNAPDMPDLPAQNPRSF